MSFVSYRVVRAPAPSRLLYPLFEVAEYGGDVSYEVMEDVLLAAEGQYGCDYNKGVGALHGYVYTIAPKLLRCERKALAAVRNYGYRVVVPREQNILVEKRERKESRQRGWALQTCVHTDRAFLSVEEVARNDVKSLVLQRRDEFARAQREEEEAHVARLRRNGLA